MSFWSQKWWLKKGIMDLWLWFLRFSLFLQRGAPNQFIYYYWRHQWSSFVKRYAWCMFQLPYVDVEILGKLVPLLHPPAQAPSGIMRSKLREGLILFSNFGLFNFFHFPIFFWLCLPMTWYDMCFSFCIDIFTKNDREYSK